MAKSGGLTDLPRPAMATESWPNKPTGLYERPYVEQSNSGLNRSFDFRAGKFIPSWYGSV